MCFAGSPNIWIGLEKQLMIINEQIQWNKIEGFCSFCNLNCIADIMLFHATATDMCSFLQILYAAILTHLIH